VEEVFYLFVIDQGFIAIPRVSNKLLSLIAQDPRRDES